MMYILIIIIANNYFKPTSQSVSPLPSKMLALSQERKLLFVALFAILMLELFILLAVNKQVKVNIINLTSNLLFLRKIPSHHILYLKNISKQMLPSMLLLSRIMI